MSPLTASDLSESLCNAFKHDIEIVRRGRYTVALLPQVDTHGDGLEIVIEDFAGGWLLTDHGLAHAYLASLTGAVEEDADIWDRVETIANRHGLEFVNGELRASAAGKGAVGPVLIELAAAIGESMQLGRGQGQQPTVRFQDEVALFLVDQRVGFVTDQYLAGGSGVRHKVDFLLRNGRTSVAQAIASEQTMRRTLNIFYDLAEASTQVDHVAFVDDAKPSYSNATFQQLSYKARVFLWGQREAFLEYWFGGGHR